MLHLLIEDPHGSSGLRRTLLDGSRPLHRRLTLLTMLAVAVTLVAVSLTGWVALRITLFDISERGSLLMAQDLVPLADRDLAVSGTLSSRVLGPGTTVVEVVRADGAILRAPGEETVLDLGEQEVAAAAKQQARTVRNTTSGIGETYRIVTVPLDAPGSVLVVGRPLTSSYEILHVFGLVVLIVGAIGLVWAWLLGRLVAKSALQPVSDFTDAVRHIADTEDLRPVSTRHPSGILATLTETFNQMLARIGESRDQQNRLIADASHELRTPLTSMRTNVELLALDARTGRLGDANRTKILDDVHAQTVAFSALIADLVHLTREDTAAREPVDLRTVVQTAVDQVHRRRASGVSIDVDLSPLDLLGDAASLERAITNVLDNAVRWSPPGGTIRVRLDGGQLHIADEGPGIADTDLPRIFDRFYRAETARATPGTGLGLAVAAKAVHGHGGTIHAASPPEGGAHLIIRLPGTFSPATPTPAEQSTARPLTQFVRAPVSPAAAT